MSMAIIALSKGSIIRKASIRILLTQKVFRDKSPYFPVGLSIFFNDKFHDVVRPLRIFYILYIHLRIAYNRLPTQEHHMK